MVRPRFRYESSRSRVLRISKLNSVPLKISESGLKVIFVPLFSETPMATSVVAGSPATVLLIVGPAVALDFQLQPFGKRIHHRHAHAVETAGDLVIRVVEFPAGMELRHHQLGGGALLGGMLADRNAAAVVLDRHRAVEVNGDVHAVAIARERLVDRVVDDLVDHVVKPRAVIGVADVHPGPFANGVQALQYLDALFVVARRISELFGLFAALGEVPNRRFGRGHEGINRSSLGPSFSGAIWLQT